MRAGSKFLGEVLKKRMNSIQKAVLTVTVLFILANIILVPVVAVRQAPAVEAPLFVAYFFFVFLVVFAGFWLYRRK